jgi:5-methylcytosine-specific restriction protein A
MKNLLNPEFKAVGASQHARARTGKKPGASVNQLLPDELPRGEHYPEGAAKKITVNRYESDRRNRRACIKAFGCSCSICGFDFEARYGKLGKGYIHVHHIKDLSTLGPDYAVNPVTDLAPVCPNCHAMLHRHGSPAMKPKKLKALLT